MSNKPHPQRQISSYGKKATFSPGKLQRVASTKYAIGYRAPKRKSARSRSNIHRMASEPFLPIEEETNSMFDLQGDLIAFKGMIFGSWVNILLIIVPFGVVSYALDWSESLTFFLNFAGMIPLAAILGDATEALAEHLGETIGGLLNATFGNAVEVVVMIMALAKAKSTDDLDVQSTLLDVVQTSLIGSIFSNSLLVLGCAFLANGFIEKESTFNTTATSANVSLLMISAFVMLLPGPYANADNEHDALTISRAAAVILILMYCCLLFFVLHTHADIIQNPEESESELKPDVDFDEHPQSKIKNQLNLQNDDPIDHDDNSIDLETDDEDELVLNKDDNNDDDDDDDDDEDPLSVIGSLIILLLSTIAVAVLSEFLVDSITPMAHKVGMSPAFVGIILLPIIGNAVEHITAVRMALRKKMDIALSIAIGSATQVAMFVVSLAILVAWAMDLDLSLAYDPFEVQLFIYSSIIIFALISDGSSNWLEGVMLLGLYVLIGIAVWDQDYHRG